jgi:hypothetical protein
MAVHTKTKSYPWLHDRHSEKVPTRRRCPIYDWRMINVALDDNRVILTFNVHWSGRTILVMLKLPLFVVAISMTTIATVLFPAIRHRNTSANKDRKSCNCEYFQNVGFHGVLLFLVKLPRLDGSRTRRVYISWKYIISSGLSTCWGNEKEGRIQLFGEIR